MDFSKLKGKIFFNNKFVPSQKASIHVLNHSLHFASAVFEGIRVYNKKVLFLDDHLERLIKSSKLMKLDCRYKKKELERIIKNLIKINKIKDGYVRPIIFRSSHSMSPETRNCHSIIAIACWEWGNLFKGEKGISLDISRFPKLNKDIYPIEAKSSGSYQISVLSRVESFEKKFDDCLMLDLKKNVAESSACNVFWLKKNIIFTPKNHSILNGITRKAVLKICKNNKIKVKEGDFKLSKILNADSVFLTGTAAEIQLVKRIKSKTFKTNYETINFLKKKFELVKLKCPSKVSKINI